MPLHEHYGGGMEGGCQYLPLGPLHGHQMPGSPPVQRFAANVRERKRMMSINTAFDELR